jgi:hypothetical protein
VEAALTAVGVAGGLEVCNVLRPGEIIAQLNFYGILIIVKFELQGKPLLGRSVAETKSMWSMLQDLIRWMTNTERRKRGRCAAAGL